MDERIVILSDTHLACASSTVRDPDELRPLWQGATHMILNGDAAEIHHPTLRAKAARQILKLQALCDEDGVHLTLISGNHDSYISDLRHLCLADGQIFVTHGDVLHPSIAPWSKAAKLLRSEVCEALDRLDPAERDTLEGRLAAAQHASHSEWARHSVEIQPRTTSCLELLLRPLAALKILNYWLHVPRLAAQFAAEHAPEARFVVFGHTHRAGIWQFGDRTIINTGGFAFPSKPRVAIIESGQLTVVPVQRIDKRFVLASGTVPKFELGAGGSIVPPHAEQCDPIRLPLHSDVA